MASRRGTAASRASRADARLDDPRTKVLTARLVGMHFSDDADEAEEGAGVADLKRRVKDRQQELSDGRPPFQMEWRQGGLIEWKDGSDEWHKQFDDLLKQDELEWKIAKLRDTQVQEKRNIARRRTHQRAVMRERQRRSFAASIERGEVHARRKSRQRAATLRTPYTLPTDMSTPATSVPFAPSTGLQHTPAPPPHTEKSSLRGPHDGHIPGAVAFGGIGATTVVSESETHDRTAEEIALARPFEFYDDAAPGDYVPANESSWSHILIPRAESRNCPSDSLGYSPEPDDPHGRRVHKSPSGRRSPARGDADSDSEDLDLDADDLQYSDMAPYPAHPALLTGAVTAKYPVFSPPAELDHYQSTKSFRSVGSRVYLKHGVASRLKAKNAATHRPRPTLDASFADTDPSATFCSTWSRTPAVPQPPPPPVAGAGRPFEGWKKGRYECTTKQYKGFQKSAQKADPTFFAPERGEQMRALPEEVVTSLWNTRATHDKSFNQYKSVPCSGARSSYYLHHLDQENAATVQRDLAGFEARLAKTACS